MASLEARLDRLEKRVNVPTAPPSGPEFRIISVLAWPEDAQVAYEAACDAGDADAVAELMERYEGIAKPEPRPERKRRRPLVARRPRIVELIVCGILDEREPILDDDEPSRTMRDAEPSPAAAEPIVESPGTNPADVVGRDAFGNVETRQDRDNRLAAEERLSAAGQDVPSPNDGPPVFDRWGGLVSGRFRPPAPSSSSFQQWDRNGNPC